MGPAKAVLLPEVAKVLQNSGINDLIVEANKVYGSQATREVLEEGEKELIVINQGKHKQIIISVRANKLSFIGRQGSSPQYLELRGTDMGNRALVEDYFAQTFVNPQVNP